MAKDNGWSRNTNYYKIIPSKRYSCADIPSVLIYLCDDEIFALGDLCRKLFYFDNKKGKGIYFSFTPSPFRVLETRKSQRELPELKNKIQEMLIHIGEGYSYDEELEQIFTKHGVYNEWKNFKFSTKSPESESERKFTTKRNKQTEIFEKLLEIFCLETKRYKWKKFDLENLLKQI